MTRKTARGRWLLVLAALLLAAPSMADASGGHGASPSRWRLHVDQPEKALEVLAGVSSASSPRIVKPEEGLIEVRLEGMGIGALNSRLVAGGVEVRALERVQPWYIPASTFWSIISFLIVLFIIWKKLLPPITDALDRRNREIRESLAAAERAKVEAAQAMERHQADLETARQDARAIIEEGKVAAERVKAGIVESARQESAEISDRALREIERAKESALADLHRQSVALSFDLTNRLIRKTLDPNDHRELISESLRKLSEEASS